MALVTLFVTLWSLVGGEVTWHNGLPPAYAQERVLSFGGFNCSTKEGWVTTNAPLRVVVHELAHAYDCLDDGKLNGSPGLYPPVTLAPWEDPAEWYAYEVVRQGKIR